MDLCLKKLIEAGTASGDEACDCRKASICGRPSLLHRPSGLTIPGLDVGRPVGA